MWDLILDVPVSPPPQRRSWKDINSADLIQNKGFGAALLW